MRFVQNRWIPKSAERSIRRSLVVHSEGTGTVSLAVEEVVPAHLLDGDEEVHFAIKPSLWFVPLSSLGWLGVSGLLLWVAYYDWVPGAAWYLYHAAFWLVVLRLGWATLQWVSRLYVLTNRRVMRIRGVFNVEMYECPLARIQDTQLTLSLAERVARVGSIHFQTAADGCFGAGGASWLMVARPLEIHEKLRQAIRRAQSRGGQGL